MKKIKNWGLRKSVVSDIQLTKMVKLYLEKGLSYRELEREVLGIDSPVRGGGFKSKSALDEIGVCYRPVGATGELPGIILKGILKRMTLSQLRAIAKKFKLIRLMHTLEVVYGTMK